MEWWPAGYDRSVSAAAHELAPKTVWNVTVPEIRFGRESAVELSASLADLNVATTRAD